MYDPIPGRRFSNHALWAWLIVVACCFASLAGSRPSRSLAAVVPVGWTYGPNLPAARSRPAVAVGKDGNIYAFGGLDGGNEYNTTFIYHPRTETWTQGSNMPFAREGARAVTMPDGRIIVMGGGTGCPQQCAIFGTTAIYTPRTNSWTPAAFMLTPRYRFAATLGGDGRVYAIGGWDGNHATYSVEAYNPKHNSWSLAPSLPLAEEAPAAATDLHGHIIVVGGFDGNDNATYYNDTFIYTGKGWTSGAAMPTARQDLAATRGPDGQIYALGGYNSNGYVTTVESYNPDSNTWSTVAPLPATTCCMGAATAPTGQIYSIGGAGSSGMQVAVLNFAPSTYPSLPAWSIPTSLPAPRIRPAVAVGHDGNIYVFGGNVDGTDYDTTFVYHPHSNTWTQGANMPFAREGGQAVTMRDGRILVMGGGTGCPQQCAVYGTAAIYTPRTNAWTQAAFMLTPRYRFGAVLGNDGRVYAMGGWDGNHALYSVEAYTPSHNSWSTLPSLPLAEDGIATAVDRHGRIVVIGGDNSGVGASAWYNNVFIYNGHGWTSGASMPTARGDFSATPGPDNKIYAIGGDNSSGYLSTVEAYNSDANSWTIATPLPAKISSLGAVTLPTGHIYTIGGAGDSSTLVAMLDLSTYIKKASAHH